MQLQNRFSSTLSVTFVSAALFLAGTDAFGQQPNYGGNAGQPAQGGPGQYQYQQQGQPPPGYYGGPPQGQPYQGNGQYQQAPGQIPYTLQQGPFPGQMPQQQYPAGQGGQQQGYPPQLGQFPGQFQGQPPPGQQPYPGQYQQGPPGGGYPGGGQQQRPTAQVQRKAVSPQEGAKIYQWFINYDEIRRRAQMNPIEKQQADGLLSRGFGLFMPGQDKAAAKQLLGGLVQRYQMALHSLQGLQPLPETRQLQDYYYQYFDTARRLFSDYMVVQDNVFAVDNSGQSVAKQLIQRKLELESLERSCKDLDAQMRQAYGIAAYQYQ